MASLFSIIARLALDSSGFKLGVKQAESAASSMAKTLKGTVAAAFGFHGIESFAKKIIEQTKEIKEHAEQMGTSAEEVQRLEKAGDKAGVSFQKLQSVFAKVDAARETAAKGNEEMRRSFLTLGVGLDELNNPGLETIDILNKIAKASQAAGDSPIFRQAFRDVAGNRGLPVLAALNLYDPKGQTKMSNEDVNYISLASREFYAEAVKRTAILAKLISGELTGEGGFGGKVFENREGDSFWNRMKARKAFLGVLFGNYTDARAPVENQDEQIRMGEAKLAKSRGEKLYRDEAEQAKLNKLKEVEAKISETIFESEFKKLDGVRKRELIQARILALETDANSLAAEGFEVEGANKRLEAARLRAEEAAIRTDDRKTEAMKEKFGLHNNITDLQRIGAQVSSSNTTINILREQLTVARGILNNTRPERNGGGEE